MAALSATVGGLLSTVRVFVSDRDCKAGRPEALLNALPERIGHVSQGFVAARDPRGALSLATQRARFQAIEQVLTFPD